MWCKTGTSCISDSMFDLLKIIMTSLLFSVSISVVSAQVDWAGPSLHVEGMPQEVAAVMERQQYEWNRGDLEGFMQGYWQSDSLMFIGKSGVTQGHAATLSRYKAGYPDTNAMGKLAFTNVRWISLGIDHGWLLGEWKLERLNGESSGGMYTLLWRRQEGSWVIVADHSS